MGRRLFNILLLALMVVGAVATYDLKHSTEEVAKKVARLHKNIGKEREAIALLKTEWSVLTQPGRLQELVTRYAEHFRLEPFSASQVATLDEIPVRPDELPPAETAMAAVPAPRTAR